MNAIVGDRYQDRLIQELYVFVAIDPKTNLEGIISFKLWGMEGAQAVLSSRELAEKIRPMIAMECQEEGKKYKLLRFRSPEEIQ